MQRRQNGQTRKSSIDEATGNAASDQLLIQESLLRIETYSISLEKVDNKHHDIQGVCFEISVKGNVDEDKEKSVKDALDELSILGKVNTTKKDADKGNWGIELLTDVSAEDVRLFLKMFLKENEFNLNFQAGVLPGEKIATPKSPPLPEDIHPERLGEIFIDQNFMGINIDSFT